MSALKPNLDSTRIPQHIAIIMDGNGRWAKKKGMARIFGHQNALKAVRETVETAAEIGVKYLTLYAFSTENWNRPQKEVQALMELLVSSINKERDTLKKNNIRLQAIGDIASLPLKCRKELDEAYKYTEKCDRMTLILALSYSARWELIEATKKIAQIVKNGEIKEDEITQELISSFLTTSKYPDPELLIRTSGEYRISNFLLWQIAYSELYFTKTLWPDFRKEDLILAVQDFQKRERRFGLTTEQITEKPPVRK